MTDTTLTPITEPTQKSCKKRNKIWRVLAIIGIFGIGFFTGKATQHAPYRAFYGQNHHMGGFNASERRLDMVLSAIDASQDQRDKIKSVVLKAMADMPAVKTQMRWLAKEGLEILSQPTIDISKVDATRQAAFKQMEANSAKHQAVLLEIAAILTPEQRQKLKLLAEMRLYSHK